MPFSDDSKVDVEEIDDLQGTGMDWELLRRLDYDGKADHFAVPVGQETDFASVPRAFVWLLPRYGRYTRAAILHDYLWRRGVPAGQLTLPEADGVFRRAMRELGVPFLQRWMMWAAVRLGALLKPNGRKHWLRDSWQVFPLLLLALPIVGPPAVVVGLGLVAFSILEALVYVPLRVNQRLRAGRPRVEPVKMVNAPMLGWTL